MRKKNAGVNRRFLFEYIYRKENPPGGKHKIASSISFVVNLFSEPFL
jgi:hypothetical protein